MNGKWEVVAEADQYPSLSQDGRCIMKPDGHPLLFVTPMHAHHVADAHNAAIAEVVRETAVRCLYHAGSYCDVKNVAAAIRREFRLEAADHD